MKILRLLIIAAGRFFAANSAFLNMLSYTESELYQLTFVDVTYEEDGNGTWIWSENLWSESGNTRLSRRACSENYSHSDCVYHRTTATFQSVSTRAGR